MSTSGIPISDSVKELLGSWIVYCLRGEIVTPLREQLGQFGHDRLFIVVETILSWLKARSLPHAKWRPILIRPEFPWMDDVPLVIQSCGEAQSIFEISETGLDLSPSLTAAERQSVLKFIDEHYRPALGVHHRPVDLEAWNSIPGNTPVRRRIADAISQIESTNSACRWVGEALRNLATEVSISEARVDKSDFLAAYADINSELRCPGAHEFDFETLRQRVEEADDNQILVSHLWSGFRHAVVVRSESNGRVIGCAVLLSMPSVPSDVSAALSRIDSGEEEA
jgi:hypothetical protein